MMGLVFVILVFFLFLKQSIWGEMGQKHLVIGLLLFGCRHSAAEFAGLKTDGLLDELVEVQIGTRIAAEMISFLGVLWLGRCFGFVTLFRSNRRK